MSKHTIKELADIMKHIDICMMATVNAAGNVESRPMSNNSEVEYKGDSYFFSTEDSAVVGEIKANDNANLAFSGRHSLINPKKIYISVLGKASIIKDKQEFKKHWNKDVEIYFKDGVDTPGLVLIKVHADTVRYWDGNDEDMIKV